MNYDDHNKMLECLKKAQEADKDLRDSCREAIKFVDKRDGQWEPEWERAADNRPQYVFDLVTPVIDQITGDINKTNFTTTVEPMGSEADEKVAETFDGLIRSILNHSNGERLFARATEGVVKGGFDAVEVVQEYVDGDSFDQDLIVKHIPGAIDRVWFGPHAKPGAEDANYCFVLTGLDEGTYKAKYGERPVSSVSADRNANAYYHRQDLIMVGRFLYMEEKTRTLHKLTDGRIVDEEQYEELADELELAGITIAVEDGRPLTRKRKVKCCYQRIFDANGWIGEATKTVFEHRLPVVPVYGNFSYDEDKVIYRGAVERLMDPQRVFNYSASREIEEGALAPRAKTWMTPKQASGHEDELADLNTSPAPVQFYNPDPEAQPPYDKGGAQINPGLRVITESMQGLINQSAGMFAANMGDAVTGNQSGVAIEALQDRGDRGNSKYLDARITMQEEVAKILVDAIPRVYGPKRQVQIVGEDGTRDIVTIGELVLDEQTGTTKVLHNLQQGKYAVHCESSPSYETRRGETVSVITEIGKIAPQAVEMGADILFKNVPGEGMDDLAGRMRQQLFNAGLIPADQMTDDEKQALQQMANQPPQPDPMMVAAQAEMEKGKAEQMKVQLDAQESAQNHEFKMKELALKETDQQISFGELQIKAQEAGINLKFKEAQTAKTAEEARAQAIENESVMSGIKDLLERLGAPTEPQAPTEMTVDGDEAPQP